MSVAEGMSAGPNDGNVVRVTETMGQWKSKATLEITRYPATIAPTVPEYVVVTVGEYDGQHVAYFTTSEWALIRQCVVGDYGAALIVAERHRQVQVEGYTAEHDAGRAHQLVDAARCYLGAGTQRPGTVPIGWPWADEYWKPSEDPKRNLEKAGALIAAALGSLSR